MQPEEVRTAAQARAIVDERGLHHVKVGVFDIDGVMRGKYMSRDKFLGALHHGYGFCDVVLGWDCDDSLYDNTAYTGWHTAYPDAALRLLPDTMRVLAHEGDTPLVLSEFAGPAEAICPRGVLRRVLQRADAMGYAVKAAAEFEFFVFDETPAACGPSTTRAEHDDPGYFGYSMLRCSVHAELYRDLLTFAEQRTCGSRDCTLRPAPG